MKTADKKATELAATFLLDYLDPEIDKSLFYEVWADRRHFNATMKNAVWRKVVVFSRSKSIREKWLGKNGLMMTSGQRSEAVANRPQRQETPLQRSC